MILYQTVVVNYKVQRGPKINILEDNGIYASKMPPLIRAIGDYGNANSSSGRPQLTLRLIVIPPGIFLRYR